MSVSLLNALLPLLLSSPVVKAPVLPEGAPAICADGTWRLQGASQSSAEGAAFHPSWVKTLEQTVTCMQAEPLARACVLIQGRYDATPFEGPVGKALGGQAAAQSLRARGRAVRVQSWLNEAGIAPDRIRDQPPPSAPSWRGVYLALLPDCLPAPPQPPPPPDPQAVRIIVNQALAQNPPSQVIRVEIPKQAPTPGPWWLGAGSGINGLLADGAEDTIGFLARVGLGWTGQHTYAHLDGGLVLGSERGQARGWESALGGGWHPLPWLMVGGRAGHRISGLEFTAPWADQTWFVGAEGAQCLGLTAGLHLCVEEFVGGGPWAQRAVDVHDTLYFVPEQTRSALHLGLTIAMRQGL